ncbi:MAG: ion transporter [Lachnospiraceae bacterium]|nr:ion transporter [Lachnospiraceae bacterium]
MSKQALEEKKKRIFEIIQIGYAGDFLSRLFDILITAAILINLFIAIFETFDVSEQYLDVLTVLETITVSGFTVEYVLRVWTADYLYRGIGEAKCRAKYMLSFNGIIDLISFLPFYLPIMFPAGAVAFRMFRVIRILRLFRINAYYDALNVIGDVLKRKKDQILSSVFIILILMTASSLCMYSLEHDAQPDVFQNAFSGFWWAVSTLLTVGYGGIYPVTAAGRILGIIITFLGVGMVAIPTGILSAGFVEQYTMLKNSTDYLMEEELKFIRLRVSGDHPWTNQRVMDLPLPPGLILAVIQRDDDTIVPKGDTIILDGDDIILGAEGGKGDIGLTLKEIVLRERHPWVGHEIRDLDISRQTLIVMIRRDGKPIIPVGSTVMQEQDAVFLYYKKNFPDENKITF